MGKNKGKRKRAREAAIAAAAARAKDDIESDEEVQDFGDDDESIDDDEAFNSDDERKYGEFFAKDDDGSDESAADDESVTSEEDDDGDGSDSGSEQDSDEEGDGGQYMLDLLNKLDAPNDDNKRAPSEAKARAAAANMVPESEFAASVVKKGNLTLDSLMAGLEDTKGFGVMQKSLKKIVQGEATQAPVAKVVSKRAERKVHYEDQAKEVSLWLEAVQQNRQAETLDFRNKERLNVTREDLIAKFVPTTEFEKAVHDALQEAGQQDEEAILKAEEAEFMKQDDMGMNELTMEEFKKRRGELAKMRALMFYHEQKRHRINKIKSKKYRRIRKKQRERAKESEMEAEAQENPDILRELEEKDEYDRMKERMTLAHKNTSKWAKRILKRGKNVDTDTRKALSAQLQRGDDLLKKMKYGRGDEDSDLSESEDLVESARKVLQETEEDETEETERKGLFKLKFMQRGIEKQRELAKEEARQLLRELGANEKLDDYDDAVMDDEIDDESPKKKRKVASKEAMNGVIGDGDLVASSLKFGKSNAISTTGGIEIDLGMEDTTTSKDDAAKSDEGQTDDKLGSSESKKKSKKRKKKKQQQSSENPVSESDEAAAGATENDKETTGSASGSQGKKQQPKMKKKNKKKNKQQKSGSAADTETAASDHANGTSNAKTESVEANDTPEGPSKAKKSSKKKKKKQKAEAAMATPSSKADVTKTVSEHTSTLTLSAAESVDNKAAGSTNSKESKKTRKKKKQKQNKEQPPQTDTDTDEANPWMSSVQAGSRDFSNLGTSGKARRPVSALKTGIVDVEQAVSVLDGGRSKPKEKRAQAEGGDQKQPKSITMLSQEELVRRAFASSDGKEVAEEFAKEKAEVEDEDNDTKTASQRKKEKEMEVVSGWGSWAGEGAPAPKPRSKLPKHLQPPKKKEQKRKRQDGKRPNVIIREKRIKKTADKYMLKEIPYPFTSREEYERAMSGSVGKEWNVTKSVKDMTRPEIQTRPGQMIQPLSLKVKKQRAPAKF